PMLYVTYSSLYRYLSYLVSSLPHYLFFPLLIRPPPCSTLFPYTTLFRSSSWLSSSTCSEPLRRSLVSQIATFTLTGGIHATGKRSEEHTSELQSRFDLVCRLLLEKKNKDTLAYYVN